MSKTSANATRKAIDALMQLGAGVTRDLSGAVEFVELRGAQITDSELKYLKDLTNLKRLSVSITGITDAGLKHLQGLTNLGFLDLTNTDVTNEGLKHLWELTLAKTIRLYGTAVSDAGVKKLKKALPDCSIKL